MATVNYTTENPVRGVHVYTWANMTNGDTGQALLSAHYPTKSVHFYGAFSNCTAILEGSNDSTSGTARYETLNDPQGNALSFSSASDSVEFFRKVQENPLLIRPSVFGGDVETSVTVKLVLVTEARN